MVIHVLGGLVGGLFGGLIVVGAIILLKAMMDFVGRETALWAIAVPLVGLTLTTLVLHGFGRRPDQPARWLRRWRTFPPDAIRSDITGDVVHTAGEEERFPWRLAPIRTAAIFTTVGFGAAMGTEAPAAYLGVAAAAGETDRGNRWRRLLRPAALAGGAAGVAALMGLPLVGAAYILEMGRRNRAPISVERLTAGLIGGLIGWGIDVVFHLNLIRLIRPNEAPRSFPQALLTALFIGALSGTITAVAGWSIEKAKKWKASPARRLLIGGMVTAATALTLVIIAEPIAAVGPGGGAILWAENSPNALPLALLAVAILRAVATTAAVAAGGTGGIFVPFIAVGDLAGRVFAPGLGLSSDLAAASGAAGGIAGGYHLPITAAAMVLGLGGPPTAQLTCLASVAIAWVAGAVTVSMLDRLKRLPPVAGPAPAH
jgi:H+/Cl- antiporter ClcA